VGACLCTGFSFSSPVYSTFMDGQVNDSMDGFVVYLCLHGDWLDMIN